MEMAAEGMRQVDLEPEIISSGSTPTFALSVDDPNINIYHPGNYVFNDCIQMSNGSAKEEDCALTVLATVISHPSPELYICDAGAKCLGLDQGAHGNASVQGHGYVVGHPELTVYSLSEEVGKLHVEGQTDLKVGDRIMIIPNHECSAANLTDYLIGIDEEGNVTGTIAVDIRGNKTLKGVNV